MEGYKFVGIVGVVALVLGVVMPSPLAGLGKSISYFASQPTGGSVIVALAVLALLFTYTGDSTRLFFLSVLTIVVVAWPSLQRGPSLHAVGRGVTTLTNGAASAVAETVALTAAAAPPLRSALLGMGGSIPWLIMLGGGALLIIAALLAPREQ